MVNLWIEMQGQTDEKPAIPIGTGEYAWPEIPRIGERVVLEGVALEITGVRHLLDHRIGAAKAGSVILEVAFEERIFSVLEF